MSFGALKGNSFSGSRTPSTSPLGMPWLPPDSRRAHPNSLTRGRLRGDCRSGRIRPDRFFLSCGGEIFFGRCVLPRRAMARRLPNLTSLILGIIQEFLVLGPEVLVLGPEALVLGRKFQAVRRRSLQRSPANALPRPWETTPGMLDKHAPVDSCFPTQLDPRSRARTTHGPAGSSGVPNVRRRCPVSHIDEMQLQSSTIGMLFAASRRVRSQPARQV